MIQEFTEYTNDPDKHTYLSKRVGEDDILDRIQTSNVNGLYICKCILYICCLSINQIVWEVRTIFRCDQLIYKYKSMAGNELYSTGRVSQNQTTQNQTTHAMFYNGCQFYFEEYLLVVTTVLFRTSSKYNVMI